MLSRLRAWQHDPLLRGVVKNSSYLFSSHALTAMLSFVQGIFAVRLLGVDGYGLVSGTVITFASNVNRFLSFRMSEMVVRYFGQALTEGKHQRAAAIAKGVGLAEAATSLLAYLVLLSLSPWAARTFAKDPQAAPLFAVFGLSLLANGVYETSRGILQATRRFDRLALINTTQSLLTAAMILSAYLLEGGIWQVLAAYLLGKVFGGLAVAISAAGQLNRSVGGGWWQAPLTGLSDWREMAKFALNTNLNGTVNLLVRDNAPLYLSALRPAAVAQSEVGYFKLALGIINLVMLPIEPFIWPTYAEITRTIAQRQWQTTRRLLRRVSVIAAGWTFAAGGGLAAFGWWLIPLLYKSQSAPAYPAVVILLVGYGFANILNWNRPLLLALGQPSFPLAVMALVGVFELGLTFWLVPAGGYLVQAAILSGYFVVSIGIIVWRGLLALRQPEGEEHQP